MPYLERRSSSATDLRRPCTPSPGLASAVLAHPPRVGSLRSSAPPPDLGHLDDESLADYLTGVLAFLPAARGARHAGQQAGGQRPRGRGAGGLGGADRDALPLGGRALLADLAVPDVEAHRGQPPARPLGRPA